MKALARRHFLRRALLMGAAGLIGPRLAFAAEAESAGDGPSRAFDAEWLRDHARELAGSAYRPPPKVSHPALAKIGYDEYQDIRFRRDRALWRGEDLQFQIDFFHPGHFFKEPVRVFQVVDGQARPLRITRSMFDYGDTRFDPPLPDDVGTAGFRLLYHTDFTRDMAAFLGASYFRAVGGEMQYGISARGIAVDTALPSGEEFPAFRTFWIERPRRDESALTVHALLDGPSLTGAYRFVIRPGQITVTSVEASLFPRKTIKRIGIAPITSMYQHGENDHRMYNDFRPEVHDSDGLAILRGNGERIWRPLVNPPEVRVNAYADENPRGFGALQRDRDFANYQDDGIYYNRRPNLWVEPQGQWGPGAIYLIEIPANEESFDNIVAFWTPREAPQPGREIRLAYNLSWGRGVPDLYSTVGRVIATRSGIGGIPGQDKGRDTQKFVIDFKGGPLDLLGKDAPVEAVISTSRGSIVEVATRPIREIDAWRTNFDLRWEGRQPVDLRCYLRLGTSALTETWSYQWTPPR